MRGDWLKKTPEPQGVNPPPATDPAITSCLSFFVFFFFVFIFVYFYSYINSSRIEVVRVYRVEVVEHGSTINTRYIVHTNKGDYECADSAFFGNKDRYKVFSSLKAGKSYEVETVGFRWEIGGWVKNIISANPVEEK